MAEAYDAELTLWTFLQQFGQRVGVGRVYNDRKGRWPDGYTIVTSPVTSGDQVEGSIITTANSRYLLSGPAGDLSQWEKLAELKEANALRRRIQEQDERTIDLLQAAWGMDDATFEVIAGLPPRWLWQWRNHYRAPTDAELARARRLMSFHQAIRLVTYGEPDYASWWSRPRPQGGVFGSKTPLEAIMVGGEAAMDSLEQSFRSQAGW